MNISPAIFLYSLIPVFIYPSSLAFNSTSTKQMSDLSSKKLVFSFEEENIEKKWIVVNDNVMGGRSKGGFDFKNNKLIFSGNTNTNGGGFSSIRTIPIDFYFKDKTGLHIRYKGDARTYKLGVRMEGKSVSYRTNFDTGNGWQEAMIPFENMDVSWRGRPLSKAEHPLQKSKIRSIEFMIYDKQDGPFKLQVDWIKSY